MIRPASPPGRRREPDTVDLEISVVDEQSDHPIDVSRWQDLARQVLEVEGIASAAELTVLFVDEPAMARLNLTFMGEDGPTDVLVFPLDGEDAPLVGRTPGSSPSGPDGEPGAGQPLLLGDVVICPAVAARNAPDHAGPYHAGTYDGEIALLVVHGILHVLGMDHATPTDDQVMAARQRELLGRCHRSPR
ncbi:rRNA maturation RNase YbeY [soil metagenome]